MEPNITSIASLIGDAARASMLMALMSGKALTATELALEADITPQTASSHLARLVKGKLLIVRKQGRHKYFQLHGLEVAQLLEQLMNISAAVLPTKIVTGPKDRELRKARVCYDHLAGSVAVSLYDSLVKSEYITDGLDNSELTEAGRMFFENLGVRLDELKTNKRPICKACLDWSERRTHLAGQLGHWIIEDVFTNRWATRDLDSRIVRFSVSGWRAFCKRYKIDPQIDIGDSYPTNPEVSLIKHLMPA